jgi:uncharacterized protein (TIGR02996 family)
MSRDLDALRAAVTADPDADAPREVLADALLEAGDPQGELIRIQLEAARDPANGELAQRERDLVNAVGPALVRNLPEGSYRLHRGTIAAARLEASRYHGAADELRRLGPALDLMAYQGDGSRRYRILPGFCSGAPLDALRALRVHHDGLSPELARQLAERVPASVRELEIEGNDLVPVAAQLFCSLPLDRLRIRSAEEPLASTIALVESAVPEIDFTRMFLFERGAIELASRPAIGRRPSLDLSGCRVAEPGAVAFARSPHLAGLRALTIESEIAEGGLRELASAPFAATLESLHVHSPYDDGEDEPPLPVTAGMVRAILDGDFPRLRDLAMPCGGQPVSGARVFGGLERLELEGARVSPAALEELLAAAPRLRHLTLRYCSADTVAHAEVLAAAATRIQTLDLCQNWIPIMTDPRRILRRAYGWRVDFEPRWEPWVQR